MTKKTKKASGTSGKKNYCRKCQKTIVQGNFYEAVNLNLDSNGYMSICKKCCNEIYEMYFSIYNNMEMAINSTCRDLDIRFSKSALSQTQAHIEKLKSKGFEANSVFGYYKSKISTTSMFKDGNDSLRYKDSDELTLEMREEAAKLQLERHFEEDDYEDLSLFWGIGFTAKDYIFLENELSSWKQTHKCDNQAEITLLKEICIKILTIRNKRAGGEPVSSDVAELQALFRTASVDPAKANAASAGKLHDTWGTWIKDIEQFRPAEWHDEQEKYQDMDGIISYINDYVVRPIKNFITGNRDFQITDNINVALDQDD